MAEDNEKLFGDKKIPMKVMFKRLMHYILPEWKAFTLAFLLIIINVAIDVALPLALRYTTDELGKVSPSLSFVINLTAGWFALSVISQVIIYFESMILQKTGQRIVYQLRMEVFLYRMLHKNLMINQKQILEVLLLKHQLLASN